MLPARVLSANQTALGVPAPVTARPQQGGWFPFSQTTVVEFCGTTTVVFFAGGEGLLLLMQPASRQAANIALATIFIVDSLYLKAMSYREMNCGVTATLGDRGPARMRLSSQSYSVSQSRYVASFPRASRIAHTVLKASRYWIYDCCVGA